MTPITWQPLPSFKPQAGNIAEPWLVALEDIGAATKYVKFKVTGLWTPLGGLPKCGPDGLVGQAMPDGQIIVTDCAVGALIGRVGGSSATLKGSAATPEPGESKPFPIGSFTVIKLPENAIGPIYVGFNILVRPIAVESLEIEIFSAS